MMKLGALLSEARLPLPQERQLADIEISGICSDSRKVKPGEIFVALRGLREDGSAFVGEALRKGAAFVICERPLAGEGIMVVPDARLALARLWDAWYAHPSAGLTVIGVTGTNGKTSTATMLAWILQCAGKQVGLIGTVASSINGEVVSVGAPHLLANMTTPDPAQLYELLALFKKRGVEIVVMEVTSHALAFEKTAPIHFTRAIFTNLSVDHLDLHGDMEAYFLEKRKLFSCCDSAIISTFGAFGKRLADGLECPHFALSYETVRNFASCGVEGICFEVLSPSNEWLAIRLPVAGEFSLENAGLAALCALSLHVESHTVKRALAEFPGVRGRMERLPSNSLGISVFLDYAHTPDALRKLLRTVRNFSAGRRVLLLFGCGGDRDRGKRREMGQIASSLSDLVILTSDNCRSEEPGQILEQILRGVDKEKPYLVIEDRREAIQRAVEIAEKGDILVLAGKGHEEYEIKGNQRLPFSERAIVEACIEARITRGKDAD